MLDGSQADSTDLARVGGRPLALRAAVWLPVTVAFALFALLQPVSRWDEPVLLAALAAIAALTLAAQVVHDSRPSGGIRIDASYAVVLLTLVLAGPLPAFVVWALPEIAGRFFLREVRIVSIGLVATLASFALGALAGAAALSALGAAPGSAGVLEMIVAGIALALTNYFVAGPLYGLGEGGPAQARTDARQVFAVMAPAAAGSIALAALAWIALPVAGVFALVLLAGAVLLPEAIMARIAASKPVRELKPPSAAALYAAAIADSLGLSRRERHTVSLAAELLPEVRPLAERDLAAELTHWVSLLGPSAPATDSLTLEAGLVAMRSGERFDNADWPYGLAAISDAPLASRIVDVARAWADLTAGGTIGLSHRDAILELRDVAGTRFDPKVVAAASRVVEREALLLGTADFQPKAHELPLPRAVRQRHLTALVRAG